MLHAEPELKWRVVADRFCDIEAECHSFDEAEKCGIHADAGTERVRYPPTLRPFV